MVVPGICQQERCQLRLREPWLPSYTVIVFVNLGNSSHSKANGIQEDKRLKIAPNFLCYSNTLLFFNCF